LKKASSPDEINWQNLGYSGLNRKIRKYITYFIALCLIFLSFLAIIQINKEFKKFDSNFKNAMQCPKVPPTKR